MKAETTYGTAVTPDRFIEMNSEGIETQVGKVTGASINSQFLRTTQVKTFTSGAGGPTEFDVYTHNMGVLFKQMLGSAASAQVGATTEYVHTIEPDASGLQGVSATVQVGRPDVNGTVQPFTFEGGKVLDWRFSIELNGILKLAVTWDFEDVKTATALATASYAADRMLFDWTEAVVTLGGSPIFVRSMNIGGTNNLDMDRRGLSQTLKKEPIAIGMRAVDGTMDAEFESLAQYNDFVSGAQDPLIITFTGDTIPGEANPYKLVITCPAIERVGESPKVGGPEIVRQPLPFRALWDGADPIVKFEYHNDQTAI